MTLNGIVNDEEIVEAISPDEHGGKRRASAELLRSVQGTSVGYHNQVSHTSLFVVSQPSRSIAPGT